MKNMPMSLWHAFTRHVLVRCFAASVLGASLSACGGGGVSVGVGIGVGVGVDVTVPPYPPAVAPLTLVLTRFAPDAVELVWGDDRRVASFLVLRNGSALASVTAATSFVDSPLVRNATYCYQVEGYDSRGWLVASTSSGCLTLDP